MFVADPAAPELDVADRHHLLRVLRLRVGEIVVACDGRGWATRCRFTGSGALLEPETAPVFAQRPVPEITVGFAPGKGDRPEWVVQKLTELGVDRIVPLATDRSVVVWRDDRAEKVAERLRRVAREAAAQSRRSWLPEVDDPSTLGAFVGDHDAKVPVALADREGEAPSLGLRAVAVGPEGGWSEAERALGLRRVTLAEATLRSETAAVALGALLGALRAGLVVAAEGAS